MATEVSHEAARKLVRKSLDELAPLMRLAVVSALAECEQEGAPVVVYEALRTHELAAMYYELGASMARNGFRTWHFYGLAVDVIHPSHGWAWWESPGVDAMQWRDKVCRVFKKNGLDWGGDWRSFKDRPHWQWGKCKASPTDVAVRLYNDAGGELAGRKAVWEAVGAT